jgi:hypothetical protein
MGQRVVFEPGRGRAAGGRGRDERKVLEKELRK